MIPIHVKSLLMSQVLQSRVLSRRYHRHEIRVTFEQTYYTYYTLSEDTWLSKLCPLQTLQNRYESGVARDWSANQGNYLRSGQQDHFFSRDRSPTGS